MLKPETNPFADAAAQRDLRVAIVHYWLVNHRGGEKVLEEICKLFPTADIYTLMYDPEKVSPLIRSRRIFTSFLNPFKKFYRTLLPLMPMALESFDLRGYDLVISSESGPARGVLTSSKTRHFCYCHTPMRYLWELYPAYRKELGSAIQRAALAPLATALRTWDYSTAARVDGFMANSRNVRQRIWKTYRRTARVVYPPVAIDRFRHEPPEEYFLIVSEMVPYKRLDYALELFSLSGRNVKVVGDGPEYSRLRRLASSNVEFCGRVPDEQLTDLYARCRAFVMPGEEDFGITMVEALASGKPVVALAKGGASEIVQDDCGVLYPEPRPSSLGAALKRFDHSELFFKPDVLQGRASRFSEAAFRRRFLAACSSMWRDGAAPTLRSQQRVQARATHSL
jgi:glycosyltransferase involved in cell wall biosynthesis